MKNIIKNLYLYLEQEESYSFVKYLQRKHSARSSRFNSYYS